MSQVEVPTSLLVAKFKPYGHRLCKWPEKPMEAGFTEPRWPSYPSYMRPASRHEDKDWSNGDYQYWIKTYEDAIFIVCRACGKSLKGSKEFRKKHLADGKCALVIRELANRFKNFDYCLICNHKMVQPKAMSWGFKFCSMDCLKEFKTTMKLSSPAIQDLLMLRKRYEI